MRFQILLLLSFFLFLFTGCATRVKIEVVQPAEINMAKMRKIAVFDFSHNVEPVDSLGDLFFNVLERNIGLDPDDSYLMDRIADYATQRLIETLLATDYFSCQNSGAIHLPPSSTSQTVDFQKIGRELKVDALILGTINKGKCNTDTFNKEKEVYDKTLKKDVTKMSPWIKRKCRLSLSYRVIKTADGSLITTKNFSRSKTEEKSGTDDFVLRDPLDFFQDMIEEILPDISRQLAPYTVTQYRKLKDDQSDDPELEHAEELVEAGFYERALAIYIEHWRKSSNPAAGYNAAILHEAKGNLNEAIELLEKIIENTSDIFYLNEHKRLLQVQTVQEQVRVQTGQK